MARAVWGVVCSVVAVGVLSGCPAPECPEVACDDGLVCRSGACLPDIQLPAHVGDIGGGCYANATCNAGGLCDAGTCVACDLGSEGCGCFGNATCFAGLTCAGGFCVDPGTTGTGALPPADPKCYSPCNSSFTNADGEFVICDADGLFEGCRGNNLCSVGNCVGPDEQLTPGNAVGDCTAETDCPSWQTCLQGRCYSNCDGNGDCPAGADGRAQQCSQHVCRTPCTAGEGGCGSGMFCDAPNGTAGVCMPSVGGDGTEVLPPNAFAVSTNRLTFSPEVDSGMVSLVNQGPNTETYVVKKASPVSALSDDIAGLSLNGDATSSVTVTLAPGESADIEVSGAGDVAASNWTGHLTIESTTGGTKKVYLARFGEPGGQWVGTMTYFADFPDEMLDEWAANPGAVDLNIEGDNAFMVKWESFISGQLSYDELKAVLRATDEESWKLGLMDEYCPDQNTACYPYDNANGFGVYTTSLNSKAVPGGVSDLPFVMNLRPDAADAAHFTGKVDTGKSLHYPGSPAVDFRLETLPENCPLSPRGELLCRVQGLTTSVLVGGRYLAEPGDDCQASVVGGTGDFELVQTPWLVPGFVANTAFDFASGNLYRYECRDKTLPASTEMTSAEELVNLSLAQANPVPDGQTRVRELSVLDGVIVDQQDMVILFKETFQSYLGIGDADTFSAYGVIRLTKSNAELEDADYAGHVQTEERTFTSGLAAPVCSEGLLDELTALSGAVSTLDPADPTDARTVANLIIDGFTDDLDPSDEIDGVTEHAHWWCEDTGLIDGGLYGDIPCPGSSRVEFFTITGSPSAAEVQGHSCNAGASVTVQPRDDIVYLKCKSGFPNCDCGLNPNQCNTCSSSEVKKLLNQGAASNSEKCSPALPDSYSDPYDVATTQRASCRDVIDDWAANAGVAYRPNPVWTCKPDVNGNRPTSCTVALESNGFPIVDRRANKNFYQDGVTSIVAPQLRDEIAEAFRYKTRFRSRTGGNIGFAPELCEEGVTYCYNPELIERTAEKIDCLIAMYEQHVDTTFGEPANDPVVKLKVQEFLQYSFAQEEIRFNFPTDGTAPELLAYPIVNEGYERLLTELAVMLGDEALTQSFAARFDLAGSNQLGFEGTLFEPDGIDLAGGAGFELYKLYQAVQYYQLALDRFYKISPSIWKSVLNYGATTADGYIDQNTVTAYLERLIRASTQKALALSEISVRYSNFNEPKLARHVIERAYTSTYIESVAMSRTMLNMIEANALLSARPQIRLSVEQAQRAYRSALRRMQEAYEQITDDRTFFGYAPDYIPFPALNPNDVNEDNAFEAVLGSVRDKVAVAGEKEDLALAQNQAYNVDSVAFQNELLNIQSTYESQLASICGTFEDVNGDVYPAIGVYADRLGDGTNAGDPCGGVGTGEISTKLNELLSANLAVQSARQALVDHAVLMQIESDRVAQECQLINAIAQFSYETDLEINELEEAINRREQAVHNMDRLTDAAFNVAGILAGGDTFSKAANVAIAAAAASATIGQLILANVFEGLNVLAQNKIGRFEAERAKWVTQQDCTFAIIESNATMQGMMLDEYHLQIQANQAMLDLASVAAEIEGLFHQAKALQATMKAQEQQLINLEAARNDPNVRIYKNDAIRNADRAFTRAVREAYRLTKVYEYYTSTSYAALDELFLVRLVSRGDIPLENYVAELEDAFSVFQEENGLPDDRVLVLSARDDILAIPRLNSSNQPLSVDERAEAFRDALFDNRRLNEDGHIKLTFPIALGQLSPLTRNHKVSRIEVEMLGNDADAVGRAYLRQVGTGVVRGLDGEKSFFAFPRRTAVINTFFNGERVFGEDVYQSRRLHDRPLANTAWELLLNFRDEPDNLDVDVSSLSDVRIYFYYTDFTAF